MTQPETQQTLNARSSTLARSALLTQLALVVLGSLFVALCARVSVPLPYSPVPLTLSNLAVLLVGLLLGGRAGFAAIALYLAEGAAGLPVFSNGSAGLFGPTAGYLLAYPFVAFIAGWTADRYGKSFLRLLAGSMAAEVVLFTSGIGWLMMMFHTPFARAAAWGLYPFFVAEIAKVAAAAGIASCIPWRAESSKAS
jgi:biotin transport system substrate-specific component